MGPIFRFTSEGTLTILTLTICSFAPEIAASSISLAAWAAKASMKLMPVFAE